MRNSKSIITVLLTLLAMVFSRSEASVGVYPQTLFINAPNRSVAISASNPTDTRQEVWVDFRYGYPLVNDSGKFYINYADSLNPQEPNAVAWLTAYPRRFVLEARESQVIRVMVQFPIGIQPGEYWSRVVISSTPRRGTLPQTPGGGLSTRIEYISQVDVPLQIRTGGVTTGLRIQGITSVVDSGKLKMGVDVSRMGNASFWGTMHFVLRDRDGRVTKKHDQHIAIFRDLVYPVIIDLEAVEQGVYILEVNVDNIRPGVAAQYRLKSDAVRFTYNLTIP